MHALFRQKSLNENSNELTHTREGNKVNIQSILLSKTCGCNDLFLQIRMFSMKFQLIYIQTEI